MTRARWAVTRSPWWHDSTTNDQVTAWRAFVVLYAYAHTRRGRQLAYYWPTATTVAPPHIIKQLGGNP